MRQRGITATDAQNHAPAGNVLHRHGSGGGDRRMSRHGVRDPGSQADTPGSGRRHSQTHIGIGGEVLGVHDHDAVPARRFCPPGDGEDIVRARVCQGPEFHSMCRSSMRFSIMVQPLGKGKPRADARGRSLTAGGKEGA